ncbi:MAG: hypothetical protein Q8909_08805, partial [Bacteroidota bacterium]|nr:hypothetical protein [Bacteroidota bacterium]
TGENDHPITLGVKVKTQGVAHTVVYKANAGEKEVAIAHSNPTDDLGEIKEFVLGKASELKDDYLLIVSTIDLSNLDQTQWDNTTVRYHLNGGASGNQAFEEDMDDTKMTPDGKLIVTKPIKLK